MNHLCLRDLTEIIGGKLRLGCLPPLGGELEPLGRMVLDSRCAGPGDVFWGLNEQQNGGSQFAEEAFARGALGAVVSGRRVEPWAGKFSLEVDDARAALWRLARAMRLRFQGQLVAVAGSGLESATRQAIGAVLACVQQTGGTPKRAFQTNTPEELSADCEAHLALSLIELDERAKLGVVELRAGMGLDIERLGNACGPHLAVLVGSGDGAGGFGTSRSLAESQAELLSALPEQGLAIIDGDDAGLRRAVRQTAAQVIWYGGGPHCDVYASDIAWRGCGLSLVVDGQPLSLPACRRRHLPAVLGAYAVGRVLKISPRRLAAALARYRPAEREMIYEPSEEYLVTT